MLYRFYRNKVSERDPFNYEYLVTKNLVFKF